MHCSRRRSVLRQAKRKGTALLGFLNSYLPLDLNQHANYYLIQSMGHTPYNLNRAGGSVLLVSFLVIGRYFFVFSQPCIYVGD